MTTDCNYYATAVDIASYRQPSRFDHDKVCVKSQT